MPTLSSSVGRPHGASTPHQYAAAAAASAPFLGSLASQASAVEHARSRFLSSIHVSTASSPPSSIGDLDEDVAPSPVLRRGGTPNPFQLHTQHSDHHSHQQPHTCDACGDLEAEFAAAVVFVETYQGPHRILRNENSGPKKEFYALYQQASVGPCPPLPLPEGQSKLELARWEKWRSLGQMTRQEAMKRYTTVLDNLVDDWRRSAGLKNGNDAQSASYVSTASSAGSVTSSLSPFPRPQVKKSTSMFERLPRIYDEFGELQERVEEEARKREELEAQILAFTQDNRLLFSRELRQIDQMRANLTTLVQSLEEDVALHYNELQQLIQQRQDLQELVDRSVTLAVERRLRRVYDIVKGWIANKAVRGVLFVLFVLRLWNFLRQRRLPQFLARFLIRLIATASSLEGGNEARRAVITSQ
ncbi:hypothetical protein Poli38472_001000 [Pythium oligandrum]|uniref:ACB domain-containing protein n=1 Tax=Pythium oligandrum TaxID=41045 RepID=A0A8K1FJQ5_PYTOL|nr:hypothetical protein Poli38472_001000 [Pythium oligandrum]|eukprot:TMW60958.1 hypothetical protein Poli38472_001000 [Pythium oligandrum]